MLNANVIQVGGSPGNWPVPENLPATATAESAVGGKNNIAIWGHRDTIFLRLGELELGDKIITSDQEEIREYKIEEIFIIIPNSNDGTFMEETPDQRLTLITCDPIGSTSRRLIITARP